ncbi:MULTISPECIES: PLD nuclease N-terminal domain-containing protein [unclassified Frankia]|uniref:PLD nuclease N-terminal domain-containing protein n=1 Tax=unclassified Frankia TaxID=2632575 RepID=UPI002AD3B08A|nr:MULTISPECIES: PLD nuclease N-terminal domain-containing protein [unclassified Frankia]
MAVPSNNDGHGGRQTAGTALAGDQRFGAVPTARTGPADGESRERGGGTVVGFVLTLALLGFWIYAIVDVALTPAASVRTLPKLAWIAIIVLFEVVGAVAWFLLGRPRRGAGAAQNSDHPAWGGRSPWTERPGARWGERNRVSTERRFPWARRGPTPPPVAPDDNPEFLRELSERIRRGDGDGTSRT